MKLTQTIYLNDMPGWTILAFGHNGHGKSATVNQLSRGAGRPG